MKHALTSFNKPHTDNIFSGKKTIEWRKKPLPLCKHEIYETKNKGGCGKVVGTMKIVRNIRFSCVDDIPFEILNMGYVSTDFINEYANGGEIYANVIENAQRYDKPKELSVFKTFCKNYYDGNCTECKYFIDGRGYEYDESDCGCNGLKPITRPPQSWCYIEDLRN